ncbi:MAG: hypothetical protein US62_C0003G0023 [Candidatus Woesebacteria bacterium GW2011_GWA1_37_8]|uniref:Glycosyltransferase RgtA/B/C/D-like domain-containing protein n=2 Tax=Candidatus Woeseibacteriota TaxID=1752722 RepID=A0A0G0NPF3_9BACT|nr:MAG: hypothetical protein US39_C0010G0022 [Microgenomates group bacterium GW2011_GWC1_37_12b]KKQ46274.1 MAG: hypothetical protein US62_C0003G0023 [Candidatus Woesebacteria bacterium GW2011_GWA1_37_8]KKQ87764.1 MAG: hypothetical protein UT10_C0001G0005 [Candidatus Woesebacteria bacterium GW2011_GWB1_38_8b]
MSGKSEVKRTFPLVLFAIVFVLNPWVIKLLSQDVFIFTLFLFYTALMILSFIKKKFTKVIIVFWVLLSFFQFESVKISKVYNSTPAEIDLQTTRMNYYEPKFARLGYYLEKQPITILFYKIEQNFFDTVDLNLYFPNYLNLISLPFLLIGLCNLFQSKKTYKYLLLFSILILTLIGVNGKFGPFLIFPFLGLAIYLGVETAVKKIWTTK